MSAIPDSVELAVLGGGINGAAIASLAATLGYSTALFEKGDFGSGTSSKSSKLIHGGIRYLETGRWGLVREALAEREALLRGKPHLVRPLPFLLPSYAGDHRPGWMLRAGMVLYDLLASTSTLPRPEWLSPTQALRRAPALRSRTLRGAGLYHDAQVDDARLVLEEIFTAEAAGAVCANYCGVTALRETADGCVLGFHDEVADSGGSVRARAVLVAAGPGTDRIRAHLLGYGRALLRPTRGTHVVLREPLADHAIVGASPVDGRIFFAMPWRGMGLIGTTDDDDDCDPDCVKPTTGDSNYLLESAQRYFPERSLSNADVVGAFAGLRPLIATTESTPSSVSREAEIVRAGRMVFVVGGKLTTYRAVARQALGSIVRVLGEPRRSPPRPQPWTQIHRSHAELALRAEREAQLVSSGLSRASAALLAARHGPRSTDLARLILQQPSLAEPIWIGRSQVCAEIAFAVLHEHARTLADVLTRRLGFAPGDPVVDRAAPSVAQCMGGVLGWDMARCEQELARYRSAL